MWWWVQYSACHEGLGELWVGQYGRHRKWPEGIGGMVMRRYKTVEISEKQLEDEIRKAPDLIEEGLRYVDHQKRTERGPLDVLFVDSGNALVVAELKVSEDDGMLLQGIDYYDYIASNVEGFGRAYKEKEIDPTQKLRLFLVAPGFSVSLLNRCKWIDIPVSLFAFQCIAFEDTPKEVVIVFRELTIPSRLQPVEVYTIEQRLGYITDSEARKTVEQLLEEIRGWDKVNVLIEAIKNDISIKVGGRVVAYLGPRRKHFVISTYDNENKWTGFPIHQEDDLETVKVLLRANVDRLAQRRSA